MTNFNALSPLTKIFCVAALGVAAAAAAAGIYMSQTDEPQAPETVPVADPYNPPAYVPPFDASDFFR